MIRASVRDLVALCQHVTEPDKRRGDGVDEPPESFRKVQWKQRREAERLARHKVEDAMNVDASDGHTEVDCVVVQAPVNQTDVNPSQEEHKTNVVEDDEERPPALRFDQFMNEFIASDIDVLDIRRLPAKPTDPLGATSVPSRREGHSITLCHGESSTLLVVFGGRQLRDLTNLLPVASKEIDPLKLERVRYAFSNDVYSYDLQSTKWELHQCTGRQPTERSDHSAVFVAPHHIVVFGGRGRSGLLFNDLFILSLHDWHWTELEARSRPSPRYWHGCCLVNGDDQLFLFGGKSDVHVYDVLQQIHVGRAIDLLLRKQQQQLAQQTSTVPLNRLVVPLAWTAPHTVGKPPSARFGLRMVRIDHDRIAVVGGWRERHSSSSQHRTVAAPRGVDVHVLDTMTMVWTKPRFSSHICRLSAPPERFLFECFYTQQSLIVFGGFSYASNGETESHSLHGTDDRHTMYKLDLRRMIWRRHVVVDAALVSTSYPHFSASAVLRSGDDDDRVHLAFTCVASHERLPLELTAIELQRRPLHELATSRGVAEGELLA